MQNGVAMDRAPQNRFKITRRPVGDTAQPPPPPSDAEKELLEQLAASPNLSVKINSMPSTQVPDHSSGVYEFDEEDKQPPVNQEEFDPDHEVSPARHSQYAPIGLSMQDQRFLSGYKPDFGGRPPPDFGRIPRANGQMYSTVDPSKPVYENKPNAYNKEWIRRQVAYKQALSRDPMYHMASQVAGRVKRRVLDLIDDPLEFADPEMVRQDPRLTVKDAYYPENPGAASTIPTAAGIPGFYSRYHVIERSIPQRYRDEYKRLMEQAATRENAIAQVIVGLRKKWNDYAFDNKLPGVPPARPTQSSSAEERESYRVVMSRIRDVLLDEYRSRLANLLALPLASITEIQYGDIVNLRQNIAELLIIKEERWVEGAYEDLPGYDTLRKVFESGNLMQTRAAFDEWDRLFNNGMFNRQRLLAVIAQSKRKEDDDFKRDAMLQLLEGKPAVDPDRNNAGAGKPIVNTRWMSLPENFGVIFFKEDLQAAVDQSLSDLAGFCKKGQIPLMDLITNTQVSSFFFDLIATNFRIFEIQAFRRNEEYRILRNMQTRRLELLVKFTTLIYDPTTDSLAFSDQPSAIFGGIMTLRNSFSSGAQDSYKRAKTSARWRPGDEPARLVYNGEASAAYKSASLRNGSEMQEFDRSREFMKNFS